MVNRCVKLVLAYLAIMFAGLLVITYWPGLSLWLVDMTGVQ